MKQVAGFVMVSALLIAGCATTTATTPPDHPPVITPDHVPITSEHPASSPSATIQPSPAHLAAIAATAYPAAKDWRPFDNSKWQGLLSPTERVVVTLDPATGAIVNKSKPQGTDGAVAAVQGFYQLLAAGNSDAAWLLLNPEAQNPDPGFGYPRTKAEFVSETNGQTATVKQILSADWAFPGPGYKYAACECFVPASGEVDVDAVLTNGQTAHVRVMQGPNGTWNLLWDYEGGNRGALD